MKKLALLMSLVALTLGFSSCCAMFGVSKQSAGHYTEERQVKTCGYDIVTEQVAVGGDAKSGMIYETVEKKVPRYKTVTKKVRIPCPQCVRFYCPVDGCCGTTGEKTIKMATAQPANGAPHIGLIPTMKPIAP